jgi:hypothetical protein
MLRTTLSASQQSMARPNRDHSSNCYENRLYFLPVGDISSLNRSFSSILHAERSARQGQRRNYPWRSQKAIFRQILTKIDRNFHPVGDISTFKSLFYFILHAERSARLFQRRNYPWRSHKAIFRQILTKVDRNFHPVGDISTFKSIFYFIFHAECSARHFQCRNNPWRAQIAIIRQIVTRIDCISFPLEIFRR